MYTNVYGFLVDEMGEMVPPPGSAADEFNAVLKRDAEWAARLAREIAGKDASAESVATFAAGLLTARAIRASAPEPGDTRGDETC